MGAAVEKREAEEKMEATCMAHQQSVSSYQQSRDGGHGSGASMQRVEELEGVILSLTEYLNAKEMQIDTLRQVNRVLADDVDERAHPLEVNQPLVAMGYIIPNNYQKRR